MLALLLIALGLVISQRRKLDLLEKKQKLAYSWIERANKQMNQRRRDMLLRVIDGRADLPPVAYHLNNLRRADEVLSWLIQNHLTGDEFARWFFIEQKGSFLAASKFIISKLEKEKETRPLYLGRDLK